ncbi:hypothetical protein HELRODRAFT_63909, partial [Helobdella robusta]|uniref:Glycoside hydrolase family 38 N-terminal domain-containing protein n=1 Tax=Helobdella robusta TaxID=6412 RepID=T1FXM3_HELRO
QAIVVPHSHNDPGWLRTIEEYFAENTESILNNMLEKLIEHQEMTFVWAETVFLSMWWNNLTDEKRKIFNMLVESGRLEIVGGGWVVPDEAVTHYSSLILNFLEGHRWLKKKILFKPKITWSLDPFGYSSFFPYLYNRIGYKSSIILRVNTYIKTEMAMKKLLHFKWRQV